MSSVNVSRQNCDVVNMAIEQVGKSTVEAYFKEPFLDEQAHYVVCCSGLVVPMMSTRLLPISAMVDLFVVQRRNAGQDITDQGHVGLNGANLPLNQRVDQNAVGTFNLRSLPMHNLSDVLMLLSSWSATFEQEYRNVGISPIHYGATAVAANGDTTPALATGFLAGSTVAAVGHMISWGISPSGVILITLNPIFSNHFYISFSPTGCAILGLDDKITTIAVTQNQVNGVIARFGEGLKDGANVILPATVSSPVTIFFNRSLLETCESRLSVHLESAFPVNKTIVSDNLQEKSSYDLASFVLKNSSTSTIFMDGTNVENKHTFTSSSNTGQLVLQSRSEMPTQWTPLLDVRYLRTLRLRLYLKIRTFNAATKTWSVEKKEFPVAENDRWTCDLRFISAE